MTEIKQGYVDFADRVTTDGKAINLGIGALRRMSGDMARTAAVLAASCVFHAIEHGNATPASNMLDALPQGWKANALRGWLEAHGPFHWNEKVERFGIDTEKRKTLAVRLASQESRLAFAKALLSVPFTDFKPASVAKPFDMEDQLARVVKAAKRATLTDEQQAQLDALRTWIVDTFTLGKKPEPTTTLEEEIAAEEAQLADEATKAAA